MIQTIVSDILEQASLLLLIIGSAFTLLYALLLIVSPQRALLLNRHADRWISMRKPTRPLEIPRNIDHHIYRHHRWIGLSVLLSASYILYQFAFVLKPAAAVQALSDNWLSAAIAAWLLDALQWFFVPASLLLIPFGALLALRPSTLKGLEQHSNRWISSRKLLHGIDKPYPVGEGWLLGRPRQLGLILLITSAYILTLLLIFFFNNSQ